ncbi:LysR family transcriptional regulator [Dickeya zeae]|uniref:Transcriptional regulator, LysR family n=1 Tax=Dickeya zeae (strain Ech586) TaxID=590409 RepID=D2BTA8_DICZ5|nr:MULTISPECIES: LysR substrate-binding domain-containing protein [Dickeya]ACZ75745.1 transcriptional regulator, LysR family [Dickeya parazeae Ech586]UCZ76394.1 LysR family transcriptional regulator [Dickeya zeae]
MHRLPPLPALRAFLAACRAGSYSAAAEELNVTHGAISRQIRILETWLGQTLFVRSGQCMVPTLHAQAFAKEMNDVLGVMDEAARRYGRGEATQLLRISAPATFTMRWLAPRLPAFYQANPGTLIQIHTATTQQLAVTSGFDLVIRLGVFNSDRFSALPFMQEHYTLLAAPSLLTRQPLSVLGDVVNHTLLDTETRPGFWSQLFDVGGLVDPGTLSWLRFDHFYVTYAALIDGLGIGPGPLPLLARDVALGRLVAPLPALRIAERTYYLLTPAGLAKTRLHHCFEQWLLEQAGNEEAV